ncbi:hypothetical protein L218DRAFT_952610 [Marasmius fiardii PR-910]|nr:hypothetical protein L218DRAFT_952610 [Marasmius fiardii PR-910]
MSMTVLSLEKQKQLYSQQLAKHTLAQWDAFRLTKEQGEEARSPKHPKSSARIKTCENQTQAKTSGRIPSRH